MRCGSCWAFSVAETWADGACIQNLVDPSVIFSVQDILSCESFMSGGCKGGQIKNAFDFVAYHGLVSEECMPYTSGNGTVAKCPPKTGSGDTRTCTAPAAAPVVSAAAVAWTPIKCTSRTTTMRTPDAIKKGVMALGSAATGFSVFEDFMHYKV
jgi:cathepsin B